MHAFPGHDRSAGRQYVHDRLHFRRRGRSELFTEHTSRAMFPVISGHASWISLARLWSLVYVGNLVGVALFAMVVAYAGPPMKVIDPEALATMARPLVERGWLLIIVSGGLAGWLMGLMAWLVSACRDTISQIVVCGSWPPPSPWSVCRMRSSAPAKCLLAYLPGKEPRGRILLFPSVHDGR